MATECKEELLYCLVCFVAVLSCTLRLYIRFYRWYKPGQVGEEIGLIIPCLENLYQGRAKQTWPFTGGHGVQCLRGGSLFKRQKLSP